MSFLIDVEGVTVRFPTKEGGELCVLNDVGLKVKAGRFVTVVGPSGCGKSTLLKLVLGSQLPTEGTVLINGKKVTRVNRDRGIVYQDYGLFPNLTVLQNIAVGPVLEKTRSLQRLAMRPVSAGESAVQGAVDLTRKLLKMESLDWTHRFSVLNFFKTGRIQRSALEEARSLLSEIGLRPGDGGKYPHELSGGMRQRVAIAQALIMKPSILLMDEPFGALDPRTRAGMQDLIHEQWLKHNITVFFVTHDLEEAVKLGTRLICLSQYWSFDNGERGVGAKIVVDRRVMGGSIRPSEFVASDEFKALTKSISHAGMNEAFLQPVSEFDLSHEDAVIPDGPLLPA